MPGQGIKSDQEKAKELEKFQQEGKALKQELGAEITRLDAQMKRSQEFIDFVNSIGDKMNAIGAKIDNFFDRFLKKN